MTETHTQAWRFVVVGLLSNASLYAAYLALTGLGGPPKLVMTVLYALGVAATFRANRAWTFRHDHARHGDTAFARYVCIYLIGYGMNLLGLTLLVDGLGLRHQFVQAILIAVIAAWLFGAQKFWVFAAAPKPASRS